MSAIDTGGTMLRGIAAHPLDPSNIVDVDLTGDELRQTALKGVCVEWGSRPPFYVVNFGMPHVVVGRHKDVFDVYLDAETFSSELPDGPGYERFDIFNGLSSISQTDGADHDRVRKLLNPFFLPAGIKRIDGIMRDMIDAQLDEIAARGGAFDCMADFAHPVVGRITLQGLLGMTEEQHAICRRMHHAFPLVRDLPPGADRPQEFLEAMSGVFAMLQDMIAERRANPRENDIVTALVKAQDEAGSIRADELIGNVFGLLAAGQGTTAVGITAMLTNLCRRRDQLDMVIADPTLIRQTVEECIRLQAPGLFSFVRFATRDTELGGTKIWKGMPVVICEHAANHDPSVYPDPLRLDIHRRPMNQLAFGTGKHHCLGNQLARRMMAATLERICQRFPGIYLPDPAFEPRMEGMFGELSPVSQPMDLGLSPPGAS